MPLERPYIRSIRISNLLSFGDAKPAIDFNSLNVIIGPNASGKSNLLNIFRILQYCPYDLNLLFSTSGGVVEWLWKGSSGIPIAEIETTIGLDLEGYEYIRHMLSFTLQGQGVGIVDEVITTAKSWFYQYQSGNPVIFNRENQLLTLNHPATSPLPGRFEISLTRSILSQIKDSYSYPILGFLSDFFPGISFYEWGRYGTPGLPQRADGPESFLTEDGGNLALVLDNLRYRLGAREFETQFSKKLEQLVPTIEEISVRTSSGMVQVYLREQGLSLPIPATRMSDGTRRYLCLLALLAHPTPPPVLCIEEPELGLHPDMLPIVAELLVEASQRTQLFVTTHSDILISALPVEAVMVCERDKTGTQLRRLDAKELEPWLAEFSLGHLWRAGEIGGKRW